MKKLFCFALIAVMLLSLLAGCSNNNGKTDDTKQSGGKTARTDLIYSIRSDPQSLDPAQCSDLVAFQVMHQIFDTAVLYQTDGSIEPGAAKSWEYLDNDTRIRFHLRDDVVFHNGDKMTAEDVAFSWNRQIIDAFKYSKLVTSNLDHAEVVDDYTVDLYLKNAFGPVLYCIGNAHMAIYSKRAVEEMGNEAFGRAPVGSGPYKVVNWQSGDYITLTANENYWRGSPTIKDITFKISTDVSAAAIALENGDVDFIYEPSSADKAHLTSLDNVSYYSTLQTGSCFLIMKLDEGPFADVRVRQAVDYALNRDEIVLGVLDGEGMPINNMCPPSVFGYDESVKGRTQDIAKAKELLAEAGYPDGFTVTLTCSEKATTSKSADILQDQLAKIGITLNLNKLENATWLAKVPSGAGEYEIACATLLGNYPDWDYQAILFTDTDKYATGIKDAHLDELFKQAAQTMDTEKRQAYYTEAQQIITENAYFIPLFSLYEEAACNSNLKGVQKSPISRFYVFDWSWQ